MGSPIDNTAENLQEWEIPVVTLDVMRILVPVDGSATAVEATHVAVGLAKSLGAELVALFVDQQRAMDPIEALETEQFEGVHHSVAGLKVAETAGLKNGVVVKQLVREGAVGYEIVQAAKDERVDMIVMGSEGRTGIKRMLLGSIAEWVLREADVPVLVVPHCSTQYCLKPRS